MKIKLKNELLFRRAFSPWYDTEPVMLLILAFAVGALLFSMAGVAAALDTPTYLAYVWVPYLLGGLSLVIIVTTFIRLFRRR
jgi:hypothetical protein